MGQRIRTTLVTLATATGMLVVAACGAEVSVETGTAPIEDGTEVTVPIADLEPEIGPAAEGMFAFIDANPDVCAVEFESFNVEYPQDDPDRTAELDEGIEDRGNALRVCLDQAGETDLSEDVALLTQWGRHLADQGR